MELWRLIPDVSQNMEKRPFFHSILGRKRAAGRRDLQSLWGKAEASGVLIIKEPLHGFRIYGIRVSGAGMKFEG